MEQMTTAEKRFKASVNSPVQPVQNRNKTQNGIPGRDMFNKPEEPEKEEDIMTMLKKRRENLTNPPACQDVAASNATTNPMITQEMLDKARANQAGKLFNAKLDEFEEEENQESSEEQPCEIEQPKFKPSENQYINI